MTTTRPTDDDAPASIHPDLVALEALRTGEAAEMVGRHVASCEACRARLARLELTEGLLRGSTERPAGEVPLEVDDAVVSTLFAEASRIRREARRPWRFRVPAWAAAAALLVAVGLWAAVGIGTRSESRPAAEGPKAASPDRFDVDGSGSVDIVDAYLLARRMRRREAVPEKWDLNGDGNVDSADVDTLGRAVVSLERSLR